MKSQELRDLEDDKLREHLVDARRDLFGLRMQHATGELENSAGLKTAKRNLARALTVARQRGIDPNASARRDDDARGAGGTDNG
jgi:large subunit ribosomal protein L29